jgi:ATP-dependent DNA helicase RecG
MVIMMNVENLKKIIEGGESVEVEFKQAFHSVQNIAKIIAAFANTQGGILIVGIKDNGSVEGIKEKVDILQQKISQSNSIIHPSPLVTIEIHTIKKKLLVIIVHKADASVFHSVKGVVYIRLGSTVQRLEGQSIVEFLRNRQILLFEESIEFSAQLEDIDRNIVKTYLEKRMQATYLETHSLQDFLISKKLASFQPDVKIKNSALLFFARDTQYFFPYVQIKLVRFDGKEPIKVFAYEDAKGSLPQMIEHSLNFVRRFIAKSFVIENIERKEIPLLPEGVVREAIINAVAHRDYFNKNETQVSIFDDRLEITNPGGLPEGMTKELLGALSIQRNPAIYQLLKDYGHMEGIGSGISKMYTIMSEQNLGKPEFVISKEFFRVILRMKKKKEIHLGENWNKRQILAVDYLKTHKKIKSHEYALLTHVSIPTAVKDLADLEKKDVVKKVGSYRGAYYILNEKGIC